MSHPGKTALILTGGGARAAYQVGVLQALQLIRREAGEKMRGSPFRIICGTSAGAINGMALASRADHYDLALRAMIEVWRDFRTEQVYRSDSLGVIRSGAQWLTLFSLGWALARWPPTRLKYSRITRGRCPAEARRVVVHPGVNRLRRASEQRRCCPTGPLAH